MPVVVTPCTKRRYSSRNRTILATITTGNALVPKVPGADARDLLPIMDCGEYDGNWVLVVPRAQTLCVIT